MPDPKSKRNKEKKESNKPAVVLPKYVRKPTERSKEIADVRGVNLGDGRIPIPWHLSGNESPKKGRPKNIEQVEDIQSAAWNAYNSVPVKEYNFKDNSVKLTKGTMNTGQVSRDILTDLIAAADRTSTPRNVMLAIAAQESMFGEASGRRDQQEIVSGWDVANKYAPVTNEDFFARKGVPNIEKYRSKKDLSLVGNENYEKSLDSALNIHPEWIEQFRNAQNNVRPRGEVNYFEEIANMAKSSGIGRINPGDPDYPNKIKRMEGYIASDPAIQNLYKDYDKNKKMPDGGKINNMPDPKKKVVDSATTMEKARASRILELSRQWGVPTASIYSQSNRNRNADQVAGTANYQSYWTFDPQGNIAQSTRDYGEAIGTSPYTPADIALQQQYPGQGMTVSKLAAIQAAQQSTAVPGAVTAATQLNRTGMSNVKPSMKNGGKTKKSKKYKIDPQYNMEYGGALQTMYQQMAAPVHGIPLLDNFVDLDNATQANYGASMGYGCVGMLDNIWAAERMPQAESGIHIKPQNKGKFTRWAKNKGMSVPEAANMVMSNTGKYSGDVVKMANFAKNARGWDHAQNGYDLEAIGRPRIPISSALENVPQNPYQTRRTDPQFYNQQQNVSNFFQNDPYAGYIPANASRQGPSFYENEFMMESGNPDNVVQTDYTPIQNQGQQQAPPPSGDPGGWSMDLSLGPAIVGVAGLVNKAYDLKNQSDAVTKMKRKNLTARSLAENPYGTGSQGIYRAGGAVRSNQRTKFSPDQIKFLANQGYSVKKYL